MDAAHTFRKSAFIWAAALLVAGAASAQPTLQVSPAKVTLDPTNYAYGATISVTSSDGTTAIPFTISTPPFWYKVTSNSGVTPATLTINNINTSCIFSGGCDQSFTLTATSPGTGTASVEVIYSNTIGGGGGGGGGSTSPLVSSINPISNTLANGSQGCLPSNPISISTASQTSIPFTMAYTPVNSWLSVFASAGSVSSGSPVQLYVCFDARSILGNTTYQGSITLTPSNGAAALSIPVSLIVGTGSASSGSLTVNPTSLSLGYPIGQSSAAVTVTSSSATSFTVTSNVAWLSVPSGTQLTNGLSGTQITASLNTSATQLSTGVYNGAITLVSNLNDTTTIPVTLSINGATGGTGVFASPTALTFAYQQGGPNPLCQTVLVTSTDSYTVGATGNFFTNTNSVTGPGSFQVCPSVIGATAQTYTGTVLVTSNTTGTSQTINSSLLVSPSGTPVINAAVNVSSGDIVCTAQTGCSATVTVSASDNSALPITITPSATWITIGAPAPTTTPGTFTVTLNAAGLTGLNTGSVSVSATGAANNPLVIPVVLGLTGAGTGGGGLTLGASSVTIAGVGSSYQQQLSISSSTTTAFTASLPSSGCTWLQVSPIGSLSTATTTSLTISASSAPATGQTNPCNITFTTASGSTTIPVTFSTSGGGSSGGITLDKTSLSFSTTPGTAPANQTIHVTSSGSGAVTYSVSASDNAPWLTVSPSNATTPGDITVGVNPGTLQTGNYVGFVQITPNGGATVRVQVNLAIAAATGVSATPTSLTFAYSAGGALPSTQSITVTGQGNNLPYSATVSSGSDWLSVNPTSGTVGTAGTTLTVSVNPQTLQANKSYTGTIVVAGTGTATGSTTVNVTLNISAPLPTISRVTNAASFNTGAISAGEIITLFGTGLGPGTLTTPPANTFPTDLSGVQVTVGGYLAPIVYVRNDQVSVIVPYEINKPVFLVNVPVILRYLGQSSNGFNQQQAATAPGIFTTGGGTGQGAILNSNLSVNSSSNPASKGDVVVLYITGEGQTSPAGQTGKITSTTPPYPTAVSGVPTVTIGGQPAQVLFAGEAPALVSGVMQINVVVPTTLTNTTVTDQPVLVTIGGTSSQTTSTGAGAVTVSVR